MEKPIECLMITDTHSGKDNAEVVEELFDQAFDLCDQLGIKQINHLGDAFDSRPGQALKVLLSVKRSIEKGVERGISMNFIPGNHDKTDLEANESYLDVVSVPVGVKVFNDWHIEQKRKALHCFIPYYKENTVYIEKLKALVTKVEQLTETLPGVYENIYLYTHVAISGVRNNGGIKVDNELKYGMFKIFTKVFVGHYHNYSRIGKNIYYIGSGRPKDFGEDEKKGFTILYKDGTHEQIQAKFPKFVKIEINLNHVDKKDVLKLITQHKHSEDNVRFVFIGNPEKFAQFETLLTNAKRLGIDVKREDENILKSMEAASSGGKIVFDYKLIKQAFIQYCAKNKIDPTMRAKGLPYVENLKNYKKHVAA